MASMIIYSTKKDRSAGYRGFIEAFDGQRRLWGRVVGLPLVRQPDALETAKNYADHEAQLHNPAPKVYYRGAVNPKLRRLCKLS